MGEVVPARTSPTLLPHPLALCCHYPVSKCCSASIVVTGTVRVNKSAMMRCWFLLRFISSDMTITTVPTFCHLSGGSSPHWSRWQTADCLAFIVLLYWGCSANREWGQWLNINSSWYFESRIFQMTWFLAVQLWSLWFLKDIPFKIKLIEATETSNS